MAPSHWLLVIKECGMKAGVVRCDLAASSSTVAFTHKWCTREETIHRAREVMSPVLDTFIPRSLW